jgi:ATP-dependent helicase/nuclease subunit B
LPNSSQTSPSPAAARGTVFTVPPGAPFVDALAAVLLDETRGDALALTRYTILLPTRRARRALAEAFLRQGDGRPLLLPLTMPLGDLDPDEAELFGAEEGAALSHSSDSADLPPPIPPLRRQLLLARAILAAGGGMTLDQAARLAGELARFLDQMQTEQVDFARLKDLVPEEYAVHWQRTLRFLGILTENWPRILEDEGCMDPALRRNRVLAAQAAFWQAQPPESPVIAAGSTGSIPATAALLDVIAGLPQGRVILPGLDREADEKTWAAVLADPAHPQHGMARLLQRLKLSPDEVREWPTPQPARLSRARLINEALWPAEVTDGWQAGAKALARAAARREQFSEALKGVRRIDCANPQEEAQVIALHLRETLEYPGRRAALVTPDRDLARRVAAELRRWNIEVDDSAGQPLAETPPGVFLRLALDLLADQAAPAPLLALLKHPLAGAGMAAAALRQAARRLEIDLLRGPRPAPGFAGLREALAAENKPAHAPLVERLERLAAPLAALMEAPEAPLGAIMDAHLRLAEALATTDLETGAARLWAGEAGEAAARFFADFRESAADLAALPGRGYPALLQALLAGAVLRPRYGRHPRLAIWGPLEARLQQADLIVLGGLNEGTWPAEPPADPWLSRPMRRDLGLPPPDRRIGLAAHDFAQGLGASTVLLTRSLRVEGTPTLPSRWLTRLDGFLKILGLPLDGADPLRWRARQAALDRPAQVRPAERPRPCPPLDARPRRLSVTQVETWRRDPYAIYARHVLKLKPLDPLDAELGAAERGEIVHRALDLFVKAFPEALPADALRRLIALGERAFAPVHARPGVWAFWWPRFLRIAHWFLEVERSRRPDLLHCHAEVAGQMSIEGPRGPFLLTAKADRIEKRRDGALAIIDYKTGSLPKWIEVDLGYAPQLPLEAAMARAGAFEGIAAAAVAELAYWQLSGGDKAGETKAAPSKDGADPNSRADKALQGLRDLIAKFDRAETCYLAIPDAARGPRYSDYAHLARVKEWSAGAGEEE